MFAELLEETFAVLPNTPAQRDRLIRAQVSLASYRIESCSDGMKEAACHVISPAGRSYLCFPNHCTCGDWTNRGPVLGTGEIEACKHQVMCFLTGSFVEPAPADYAAPFADADGAEVETEPPEQHGAGWEPEELDEDDAPEGPEPDLSDEQILRIR
jgi:hypothetical protein